MAGQRKYLGLSAEARKEHRRTALFEAALDCVVDDEVELSVRAICAKARLTPRYFYESFANLDELLVTLVELIGREAFEAGRAGVAEAPPRLYDTCRAAFAGTFDELTADPRKARLMLVTAAGSDLLNRTRRALVLEYTEGLLGYIAATVGSEMAMTERVRAGALFLIGGATELVTSVLAGTVVMPEDELADTVADLLAAGLVALTR